VSASQCTVVGSGHVEVRCISSPGVGVNYTWSLSVAGQASLPLSTVTTSFGPPTVTALVLSGPGVLSAQPSAAPTAGGATVTLFGTNFGADAGALVVTWGGMSVQPVSLVQSHTKLSFTTLPGQGAPVAITVAVAGQATRWLGESATPLQVRRAQCPF
jgi:hypothetical protein